MQQRAGSPSDRPEGHLDVPAEARAHAFAGALQTLRADGATTNHAAKHEATHDAPQPASHPKPQPAPHVPETPDLTRLRDFAHASGDWLWETDADLRYIWISDAFEGATGLSSDSVIGQPVHDVPLLDDQGRPLGSGQTLHGLLQGHGPVRRVLTHKATPDGLRVISRSAVPVHAEDGRFTGYRGTARDVTAQVTHAQEAQARADLLRKLSAQVPGVIFQFHQTADHRIHYLYASDACRFVFGLEPPPEGVGASQDLVCPQIHPDDAAGVQRSLVEAGHQLRPWNRECRLLRDGKVVWLEMRAMPEPHPAGGVLWHGFASDVTARKETELALRLGERRWSMAAEAAGIGIAQLDVVTNRMTLDALARSNHGVPATQLDLSLDDWIALIHPDERDAAERTMRRAMREHGTVEARYRTVRADGREHMLEISAHCTHDAEGRVTGLLGTCRDITQHVAHDRLQRERDAAEQASRAKSEFLSRVSHELRTPLNGILGFAQLMLLDGSNPLPPEQARRLDSVLHAGRHLLGLINDVLDLSRIEQGDFSLQRQPVDLMAALQGCIGMVGPMADEASVRLEVTGPPEAWVSGDTRALEQVLINLLSNAIKYNRHGGLASVRVEAGKLHVHVSVSDEGEGLTAWQQAHLFEPFNRLGAEQRRVEGTGLGLVIARALAQGLQGDLEVSSRPGEGATFTLTLPAAPAPAPVPAAPQADPEAAAAQGTVQREVVYIEDEPVNQLLMRELFRARPQWSLHMESDGTSGLAYLATHQPHLVLIDMNLPDMNGLQLIRQLRATPGMQHLVCVALSADAMQSQIDAAMAAGYNGYWTKPIHVPQVLDGLSRLLQGS